MTNKELAAIRARLEAATPGPWVQWAGWGWPQAAADAGFIEQSDVTGVWWPIRETGRTQDDTPLIECARPADQAFVACARTDVETLLAEVERLRERLAAVTGFGEHD